MDHLCFRSNYSERRGSLPNAYNPYMPSSPKKTNHSGDRFIGLRSTFDTQTNPFKISKDSSKKHTPSSPSESNIRQKERRLDIFEGVMFPNRSAQSPASQTKTMMSPSTPKCRRVLNFNESSSPQKASVRLLDGNENQTPFKHKKKITREISQVPEQVLDAPDLLDDYYLNLLDWGAKNYMAVGLDQNVYLWNATDGTTQHLLQLNNDNHVTSVCWDKDATTLAVGDDLGTVQLWDASRAECIRTIEAHSARVGALSWLNKTTITSASRDSHIINHDLRSPTPISTTLRNHNQEVCGLKWNSSTQQLASGGNDNCLNIWDLRSTQPVYTFNEHIAAVKALAWCPFQPNVLVSGGGTADRTLKFWNTSTGSLMSSIDTGSQVCAVQWSKHYQELVSSHGFSQNQLCVWEWPTMNKITQLSGHTSRVLHLVLSPDGTTVCSAAADETLRFWKIFDRNSSKNSVGPLNKSGLLSMAAIR